MSTLQDVFNFVFEYRASIYILIFTIIYLRMRDKMKAQEMQYLAHKETLLSEILEVKERNLKYLEAADKEFQRAKQLADIIRSIKYDNASLSEVGKARIYELTGFSIDENNAMFNK